MVVPLRVLVLEDRPADAELALRELRRAGFAPEWQRVETEADYLAGLDPTLDLILADYSLPQFDAIQALELVRARGLDTPFIIVSGTIGEESAVAAMQKGADDYVLKDRLARLGSAVQHALEQRHLRIEKQRAETALLENARLNQAVLRALTAEIAVLDPTGTIIAINDAWAQFARTHGDSLLNTTGIGANYLEVCRRAADHSGDQEAALVLAGLRAILDGQQSRFTLEYSCQTPTEQLWFVMNMTPLADHGGAVVAHEDITELKHAERALAERVRLAALAADVGIALTR
ncbi:MAG: response regulator, partial [Roseiflexaceae bacterium]